MADFSLDDTKSILRSRTFWGAAIAIAGGIAGAMGHAISASDQAVIADQAAVIASSIGPVIGGFMAIWGRLSARKAIA